MATGIDPQESAEECLGVTPGHEIRWDIDLDLDAALGRA